MNKCNTVTGNNLYFVQMDIRNTFNRNGPKYCNFWVVLGIKITINLYLDLVNSSKLRKKLILQNVTFLN